MSVRGTSHDGETTTAKDAVAVSYAPSAASIAPVAPPSSAVNATLYVPPATPAGATKRRPAASFASTAFNADIRPRRVAVAPRVTRPCATPAVATPSTATPGCGSTTASAPPSTACRVRVISAPGVSARSTSETEKPAPLMAATPSSCAARSPGGRCHTGESFTGVTSTMRVAVKPSLPPPSTTPLPPPSTKLRWT